MTSPGAQNNILEVCLAFAQIGTLDLIRYMGSLDETCCAFILCSYNVKTKTRAQPNFWLQPRSHDMVVDCEIGEDGLLASKEVATHGTPDSLFIQQTRVEQFCGKGRTLLSLTAMFEFVMKQ